MSDLFAGVDSSFVNKLFQSLDYPLTIRIEGEALSGKERSDDGEYSVLTRVEDDPTAAGADGDEMLDRTIESYTAALAITNGPNGATAGEIERDLRALFDPSLKNETILVPGQTNPKNVTDLTAEDVAALEAADDNGLLGGLRSLWEKIKKAVKKVARIFVQNFAAFLKKYFKFTLKYTDLKITRLPTAVMSNPISINNVEMEARVAVEACIYLGRWRCADITTGWVKFKAEGFDIKMISTGLNIAAEPSVREMKFVVKISLFGYNFPIEIGISKVVNKYLKKKGPQPIVDLSGFEFEFAVLKRKFVVESVGFSHEPNWIEADLSGRIART
jgi:hypothetical protein